MKQKKVVMCWASINGSQYLSMVGIPFDGIACFERTANENGIHMWKVHLKQEYKIDGIEVSSVADTHYDPVNDDTIWNMCALESVAAE